MTVRQITWFLYIQLCNGWLTFWQREGGANMVFVALSMTVLLGFAGLAVDGSNIYYQNQRMQIAADAAALGGARKLAASVGYEAIDAEIRQLAIANYADSDPDAVRWSYINNNRGVHVMASRTFPAYFARIYGRTEFTVSAEADAQYEPVTGVDELFPLTLDCDCKDGDGIIPGENGGGGGSGSSPTPSPTPSNDTSPTSGTVTFSDTLSSSYVITYVGQTETTWTYEVSEVEGADLSHWVLSINSCLDRIVTSSPGGAELGVDGSTGVSGIKWNVNDSFTRGTFSFTLNGNYPSGVVNALAKAGDVYGTVQIRGPVCDGTNIGDGGDDGGSGTPSLCIPTLNFETDAAGAALVAGQIIDTEWAAWGARVTTGSPSNHPAMIFNTANPTGGDTDLGSPNQAFGGPGVGVGGGASMPGRNSAPLGKALIVAETLNAANPDDSANGGTLIFTFDTPVRLDEVQVLDIDDASAAGTVKAYRDSNGSTLIATGKMLGLGDNSFQTVGVNATEVRRLEIHFPKGGAAASVVSCRNQAQPTYTLGSLIWSDSNSNGLQDVGEPGIAGVELELTLSGQSYVIASTTTNAGGEYLFSNLPTGNYEVKIASSNFNAGKPLAGATYTTPNSGSDDTRDSDFSSSTGRAPGTITTVNNTMVDGGFRLPASGSPQSAVINIEDNRNSTFEVTLESVVGNTWTYRVREIAGRDLSHWNLGIANCIDKIIASSPSGAEIGTDGSTGFVGIKWNVTDSFTNSTFSFTVNGSYPAKSVQALVKAGNTGAQLPIAGPDCSAPITPTPTPTGTPVATATPTATPTPVATSTPDATATPPANACSIRWLDWHGNGSSDLEDDMADTSRSGVWKLGMIVPTTVPSGSDVDDSSAALDALVASGASVRIPLTDFENGGAICGFANVTLMAHDYPDNWWAIPEFLNTLIHGVETDPTEIDYGARDIRFER
jgi:hypothetical protein